MFKRLIFLVLLGGCTLSLNVLAESTCDDFGKKLRDFGQLTDKAQLNELINIPLFAKDDEKYAEALARLNDKAKIAAFIARNDLNGLSSQARERRARALLKLSRFDESTVKRALYVHLAETQAARTLTNMNLNDVDWLRRLEVLSDRNDNDLVISEIEKRDPKATKQCRVQFLLGKAYRKNREYSDALRVLDKVATTCEGNDALNAGFLLARLAAITPSQDNMKYFARFIQKYPLHSYVDDVLLFKASAQETLGRREEAKKTLQAIWEMKGVADMRYEAVFRMAFLYALEDKSLEAIKILDSALTSAKEPPPTQNQLQRAQYWSARLRVYPHLANFKKDNTKVDAVAKARLSELANSKQATYYTWLAQNLLSKESIKTAPARVAPKSKASTQDVKDKNFSTIFCLFANGYKDESRYLLSLFETADIQAEQRMIIANKLNEIGEFSDAFRFAHSAPYSNEILDNPYLMYPRAFSDSVEDASKRVGPPQFLLYGLMREESRFDPRAISWAGARGVFQLMPEVARSEGSKFKMSKITPEQMLDPKVSILLGSAHLKGMLDGLKHPLFAIAAYNAGMKRAKTWQERWEDYRLVDAFVENIPLPETREYVKRVAGSWVNYAQLYANNDLPFSFEIKE